jgi:predicted DNA-binding transcriptional regulator
MLLLYADRPGHVRSIVVLVLLKEHVVSILKRGLLSKRLNQLAWVDTCVALVTAIMEQIIKVPASETKGL